MLPGTMVGICLPVYVLPYHPGYTHHPAVPPCYTLYVTGWSGHVEEARGAQPKRNPWVRDKEASQDPKSVTHRGGMMRRVTPLSL